MKFENLIIPFSVTIVIGMCVGVIMAVDYFSDGCSTGNTYYKQVRPGIYEKRTATVCDQLILQTERGQARHGIHMP